MPEDGVEITLAQVDKEINVWLWLPKDVRINQGFVCGLLRFFDSKVVDLGVLNLDVALTFWPSLRATATWRIRNLS